MTVIFHHVKPRPDKHDRENTRVLANTWFERVSIRVRTISAFVEEIRYPGSGLNNVSTRVCESNERLCYGQARILA